MGITAERQQRGVRRRERQRRRRQRRSTIAGPLSAFSFPFSSRSPLVALSSQFPVQFSDRRLRRIPNRFSPKVEAEATAKRNKSTTSLDADYIFLGSR